MTSVRYGSTGAMVLGWAIVSYTTLLLCSLIRQLDCISLAPVYWNMSNPIFKTSKNDHMIEVQLYDDIDFVCPHYPPESTSTPEYYTIYMVTRTVYAHCSLGADNSWMKMILNCSEPEKRRRFTILFEPYQSIPRAPEYHPGNRYYFITTSTGDKVGLDNTHQGACHSSNMRLSVQVCCRPQPAVRNQQKTNAVDELLLSSGTHIYDRRMSVDRVVNNARPTPGISAHFKLVDTAVVSRSGAFVRQRGHRRQGLTAVSLNKSRSNLGERLENSVSLTEDEVYSLQQTGSDVVPSSQPAAVSRMTSLSLGLLCLACSRHLVQR